MVNAHPPTRPLSRSAAQPLSSSAIPFRTRTGLTIPTGRTQAKRRRCRGHAALLCAPCWRSASGVPVPVLARVRPVMYAHTYVHTYIISLPVPKPTPTSLHDVSRARLPARPPQRSGGCSYVLAAITSPSRSMQRSANAEPGVKSKHRRRRVVIGSRTHKGPS